MKNQYWPNEMYDAQKFGIAWEMRTDLAWRLISHFALVSGVDEGEDSAGRSRLHLLEPQKVVERAFAITDIFVDTVEARGGFRPEAITDEQRAKHSAEMEQIKSDRLWKKMREVSDTK